MDRVSCFLIDKLSIKSLLPVFFIFIMFSAFTASAQLRKDPWATYGGGVSYQSGYAIALNTGYDAPLGSLGSIFKPAPAFDLNFLTYRGNFIINAGFGYHVYKPKADTLYYNAGIGGTGYVAYQNFPVYAIYTGAAYNLGITDNFRIYAGANFGYYFSRFAYRQADIFGSNSADFFEDDPYLAPKIGLNIMINSTIGLGAEAKYNLFSPADNSQGDPLAQTLLTSGAVDFVLTVKL
jgi:hypothetical protein